MSELRSKFHAGELEAQARAGVRDKSHLLERGIHDTLPEAGRAFLAQQGLAVLATVDSAGRPWASLLTGAPGFLRAPSEREVEIALALPPGDPALANLAQPGEAGLLAIELERRRRVRVNGQARLGEDGILHLHVRQAFSNCPQYIQVREYTRGEFSSTPAETRHGSALTAGQQRWIGAGDTFFIASRHPEAGADASHRGGSPGFVEVVAPGRLRFPDYPGNNMYCTVGNLLVEPRAGLLFVDFERGATLQLSGEAQVLWQGGEVARFPGAERAVEFRIHEVRETHHAFSERWELREPWPRNPAPPSI